MALTWSKIRCLENSLIDFLNTNLVADAIKDINGVQIVARVGRKEDNDWQLPCITAYVDTINLQRLFVGSNTRLDSYLMIIDIYATNEGERMDLATWVADEINNGFTFYNYTPSESTPNSPVRVSGGLASLDFLSNTRVALGQNVGIEDAHRHRISINVWISGS